MAEGLFEFLGLLFGVVGIITYFIGRHQGRKESESMKKEIKEHIDDVSDAVIEKNVDIANAQTRVKDGGKVALRDKKVIGAHERNVNETVNIGEDVIAVVRSQKRELTENVPVGDSVSVKVGRAKDKEVVTRQKKTFTIDTVLVNENDKENKKDEDSDK